MYYNDLIISVGTMIEKLNYNFVFDNFEEKQFYMLITFY